MGQELLGQRVPGRCIVTSDPAGSWKAAVPFLPLIALALSVIVWPDREDPGLAVFMGLVLVGSVLAAVFRTVLWYRCGDDSLWDDGRHLLWARGGRVVSCVPWEDLTWVEMSLGARFPALYWGLWDRDASALPRVYVHSRTAPATTIIRPSWAGQKWSGEIASLVLTNRPAVLAAREQLERACAAHGVAGEDRPRTIAEALAAQRAAEHDADADPQ